MKKLILLCAAGAMAAVARAQVSIPFQEVDYDVHYHLGLINVSIAKGHATMQTDGDSFSATLNGHSIPWEGRVFCVSDTLRAVMTPRADGLASESVTYQNGWYMKPAADCYGGGGFSTSAGVPYRNILGAGDLDASAQTMEAITVTSDMLAMFYYFREIDFDAMRPGDVITIPIEGGLARSATVTYNGCGGDAYSVDFEYDYDGAPSGYPVHADVSAATRLPQLISASLPIGRVEMRLTM